MAAGCAAIYGSVPGARNDAGATVACKDKGMEPVETIMDTLLGANFGARGGCDGCYGRGAAALGLEREKE